MTRPGETKAPADIWPPPGGNILDQCEFYRLFDEAESIRWKITDVPFDKIRRDLLNPRLLLILQEAAFAELTTHRASQNFLSEFSNDFDFTNWVAVWFYEETKHPMAILRYLEQFGISMDSKTIAAGRDSTAQFMPSNFGMLVTNVISEMIASSLYAQASKMSEEPVLKQLTRWISGDEARHASGFFKYATRYLERSADPDTDRLIALKVLNGWLFGGNTMQHPINQAYNRVDGKRAIDEKHSFDITDETKNRVCKMIGKLVGYRLEQPSDVRRELARHLLLSKAAAGA